MVNCIVDCQFKNPMIKTDVSDHFLNAMALRTDKPIHQNQKVQNIHKCNDDDKAIKSFK